MFKDILKNQVLLHWCHLQRCGTACEVLHCFVGSYKTWPRSKGISI